MSSHLDNMLFLIISVSDFIAFFLGRVNNSPMTNGQVIDHIAFNSCLTLCVDSVGCEILAENINQNLKLELSSFIIYFCVFNSFKYN